MAIRKRSGAMGFGAVRFETMGSGTVRFETMWSGTVRFETMGSGTVRFETMGSGTVRFETMGSGTVRFEAMRSGTLRMATGAERFGAGSPGSAGVPIIFPVVFLVKDLSAVVVQPVVQVRSFSRIKLFVSSASILLELTLLLADVFAVIQESCSFASGELTAFGSTVDTIQLVQLFGLNAVLGVCPRLVITLRIL